MDRIINTMAFSLKFCCLFLVFYFLNGCADKSVVFKEVYLPVKCQAQMPIKPSNNGSFNAHKKLMIYYLKCENLLKNCIGEKND